MIITGTISRFGMQIYGQGFKVTKVGTGLCELNLSESFTTPVALALSVFGSGSRISIKTVDFDHNCFCIETRGANGACADLQWSFIATD